MSEGTMWTIYMVILVTMVVLIAFAIWRGRKVVAANLKVVENQERIILQNERVAVATERQADALERLATALEAHKTDG